MSDSLVIVGGGQAAAQAVQSLRQQGFSEPIVLLGDEPHPPYQRPPLSKKYLAGELPRERLWLRPESFYAERGVTLELGVRAEELDLAARAVRLSDGRTIRYGRLLLATGSRPRRLAIPGERLKGVHYLRSIADVDAIARDLTPGAKLVMVGAGYIGLEVAAVARQRGFDVTVLEAADRVMARVVCPEVSAFYERCHREAGVEFHLSATVTALHGEERVSAVETATGERVPCDVVVIGIGVQPNVELAQAAGLPCADGILVDEYARTADPLVVAAGDCTRHPLPPSGTQVRLESVANAVHQAKVAAATLAGTPTPYSEIPWFWSDQYDLKLQIVGLSTGYERVVIRGNPGARSFAAYYLAGDRLLAVDAINSPRDFAVAKKIVGKSLGALAERLADPSLDLAALAS
jgi:3-phenylpropionate/trans-cinnamate dioxygenase ferredoxin reductase subunit